LKVIIGAVMWTCSVWLETHFVCSCLVHDRWLNVQWSYLI